MEFSPEQPMDSVDEFRRRHGLPEIINDKENRAQALHLACLTLMTNQASPAVTMQLLKRAEVFLKYIQEGSISS